MKDITDTATIIGFLGGEAVWLETHNVDNMKYAMDWLKKAEKVLPYNPCPFRRNGHIDGCEWTPGVNPNQHSKECTDWQETRI